MAMKGGLRLSIQGPKGFGLLVNASDVLLIPVRVLVGKRSKKSFQCAHQMDGKE
jgi:hypothetical protein